MAQTQKLLPTPDLEYLEQTSFDARGLKSKYYIKKESMKKIFYERSDHEVVAGKLQFDTA